MKLINLILLLFLVFIVFFLLGYNLTDIYSGLTNNINIDSLNSSDYNISNNSIEFDLISDLNISYEVIKNKANKEVLDTICANYS